MTYEKNAKFGNWTVLKDSEIKNKKRYSFCRCDCGHQMLVRHEVLNKATSKYCLECRHLESVINVGDKFGKWTVIQEIPSIDKRRLFIVQCDCGIIKTQKAIRLRFGDSLGCRKCGSTKHDMVHSKTYSTWESMIQRCTNAKHRNYKHYGARGISICERWLVFDNFLEDMGERPENKELDRIDNNGNYDKSNCRWVTHQENLLNRKR